MNINNTIHINNKSNFDKILEEKYVKYLCEELELCILKNYNNDSGIFFDIDVFDKKYDINNMKYTLNIIEIVKKLMCESQWNFLLCYGDTVLCIYDKNLPKSLENFIKES
jgi:hypothetical protein